MKKRYNNYYKTTKNSRNMMSEKELNVKLHAEMDKQLQARRTRLEQAVHEEDTEQLWKLITATVEEGFIMFFQLEGKEAHAMRGRSKVTFQKNRRKK